MSSNVKKNIIYQILYQILTLILPIITSPYIARVIGAQGLGIYAYSFSVAFYFVLFSMLGLTNYGNRIVAQVRDDRNNLDHVFSNILWLHVIISLICILLYILYVVSLKEDQVFAWIQLFYLFSGLLDISWFYFGIEQFKMTVTRNTIIKVFNVVGVFVFVKSQNDLWIYCLIMSLGYFFSQLVLWIPLKKYVSIQSPNFREMKVHIKPLLVLFIPAIAVSLYKYMDKIMIGWLSNKVQLGFYENAEKIVNIPVTVIQSFGIVLLPKISNLMANKDRDSTIKYIELSMRYVMWLAFALAFGLAAVGNVFAPIFWGEEFRISGILIMGLSFTIPFITFANILRTQYLIPAEKDSEYVVSVIAGAIINIIINGLLIGKLGAVGAMIGTIFAEVTVCVIQAIAVRKELPIFDYLKGCVSPAIFGLCMFLVVYFEKMIDAKPLIILFIQILTGGFIYLICSVVYFSVTSDPYLSEFKQKINVILKIKRKIRRG